MKKIIFPSEWLLLGLSGLLDIVEEIRDPFGLLENYYTNFLGYENHRYVKQNIYQVVRNNFKTANIEKIIENGKVYYQLTRQGKEKVRKNFPLLSLQKRKWEGKWRLAVYDVEEIKRSKRRAIREKLKDLGFSQFQKSVWISPHDFLIDLYEFFQAKNLLDKVVLIETDKLLVEDAKGLANRLWQLEDLNKRYEEIYKELRKIDEGKVINKMTDRTSLYKLKEKVVQIFLADPYLPNDLLPDDWYGGKVKELVERLKFFRQ